MAMLACARLGAIHSVVFGGFASHELAVRIDDARPRVVLSASCGLEGARTIAYKPLLDAALEEAAHAPRALRDPAAPAAHRRADAGPRPRLGRARRRRRQPAPCVSVLATDPLYILYTSGTTGRPKGVVRDNGGHAVALAWSMPNIYDVHPGEVFWAASDVGWVVGHSYIVYAPLLVGGTTVLYEGKPVGTPDAGAFWRVIERARRGGAVHGTHRDPGDPQGGSRGGAARRSRNCRRCARCSWPASAPIPTPTSGRAACSAAP